MKLNEAAQAPKSAASGITPCKDCGYASEGTWLKHGRCDECIKQANQPAQPFPQFDNTKHVLYPATLIPLPDGTFVTFQVLLDAHEYWLNTRTSTAAVLREVLEELRLEAFAASSNDETLMCMAVDLDDIRRIIAKRM